MHNKRKFSTPFEGRTSLEERLFNHVSSRWGPDKTKIIGLQADGIPRSARKISKILNMPLASTYRHINALEKAGFLFVPDRELTREGKRYNVYQLLEEIRLNFGKSLRECRDYEQGKYRDLVLFVKPKTALQPEIDELGMLESYLKNIKNTRPMTGELLTTLLDESEHTITELSKSTNIPEASVKTILNVLVSKDLAFIKGKARKTKKVYINTEYISMVKEAFGLKIEPELDEIVASPIEELEAVITYIPKTRDEIKAQILQDPLSSVTRRVFAMMLDGQAYTLTQLKARILKEIPETKYSDLDKLLSASLTKLYDVELISTVGDSKEYQISLDVMNQLNDYKCITSECIREETTNKELKAIYLEKRLEEKLEEPVEEVKPPKPEIIKESIDDFIGPDISDLLDFIEPEEELYVPGLEKYKEDKVGKEKPKKVIKDPPTLRFLKAISDGEPHSYHYIIKTARISARYFNEYLNELQEKDMIQINEVLSTSPEGRGMIKVYQTNPEADDKIEEMLNPPESIILKKSSPVRDATLRTSILDVMQDGEKHCAKEFIERLNSVPATKIYACLNAMVKYGHVEMLAKEPRPMEFYNSQRGPKNVHMYRTPQSISSEV